MMAAAAPVLSSRVELRFSARDIVSKDLLSSSDPFLVAHVSVRGAWVKLGQTEKLDNTKHPSWATGIPVEYRFEETQPLRFDVYDFDVATNHDYIGSFFTTLGRVMGGRGNVQTGPLVHAPGGVAPSGTSTANPSRGTLTVLGSEVKDGASDSLRIQFRGAGLDKKDLFGSSDPYLTLSRLLPNGQKQRVWSGPVLKNTLNPLWPALDIPLGPLGGGNAAAGAPLVIDCWDWDKDSDRDLIGTTDPLTVADLLGAPASARTWRLNNPKKAAKKGASYGGSGTLGVVSACIVHVPTLLEYLQGGCQISLVAAVDFTGSNGDPRDPRSLHYVNPNPAAGLNQYGSTLASVGSILLEYDYDKSVPAYGFGGAVGGATSHCFPLTLNPAAAEVPGVDGMLSAYRHALQHVGLSGPTLFAPVLRAATAAACEGAAGAGGGAAVGLVPLPQRYTVLLILTDGAINDLEETIDAIVEASHVAPLSVVIVGVGSADFSSMSALDADAQPGGLLTDSRGRRAAADIVQFVAFRDFWGRPDGGAALASAVLAEVPRQLVGYFTRRGIAPGPRIVVAGAPGFHTV